MRRLSSVSVCFSVCEQDFFKVVDEFLRNLPAEKSWILDNQFKF